MVKERIVLGHKISEREIDIDPAKVELIGKFSSPTNVKRIRSLLMHVGFYRIFQRLLSL